MNSLMVFFNYKELKMTTDKTVWYKQIGSDDSLVRSAIITAKATGSIGATEAYTDIDGNIERFATVRREGHQEADYILV